MIEERRNYQRVKVAHPALFLTSIYPIPRATSTVNLSLGGVKLATPYCLMIGQMIDLTLAVGERVISCKGQVVYALEDAGGPITGVRFEGIPKQDSLYLEKHISSLLEARKEVACFQLS
jgi:hypothetical protein